MQVTPLKKNVLITGLFIFNLAQNFGREEILEWRLSISPISSLHLVLIIPLQCSCMSNIYPFINSSGVVCLYITECKRSIVTLIKKGDTSSSSASYRFRSSQIE